MVVRPLEAVIARSKFPSGLQSSLRVRNFGRNECFWRRLKTTLSALCEAIEHGEKGNL